MRRRPRRISYRRRLAADFLLRYAACLTLAAPALAVALATGALVPLLVFALLLYPACGFYLRSFLHARVIWLQVEPARRIGEAGRTMLWLWPVQGARFLRRLRAGGRVEALSPAE